MFARTERLILRPSWPEDAAALAKALSHPDIARNLLNVPTACNENDAAELISRQRDPRLPEFLALARTRGAPRLVGGAGILRREDGKLELSYWVERAHWGLGFATEAARAVMRLAQASGLIGVSAGHVIDNPSSARVLRKIGFRPTGRIERRHSRARAGDVGMAMFEYDGETAQRGDSAMELYQDAA